MSLQTIKAIWVTLRNSKAISVLIPILIRAVKKYGTVEVGYVLGEFSDGSTLENVRYGYSLKEKLGVRLLDMTDFEQELILSIRNGKTVQIMEDI